MEEKIHGGSQFLSPDLILKQAGVEVGSVVAHLGCGALGHFVFPAARRVGKSGLVYAVDVQRNIVENLGRRVVVEGLDNLKTVWADLEILGSTKIPDESVDVALLISILFQSKKKEDIFREAARVLKKGGRLMVIDWQPADMPIGPPREIRVEKSEARQIAHEFNLSELEEFTAGPYHYGILFKK